jgi:hypothetical protein
MAIEGKNNSGNDVFQKILGLSQSLIVFSEHPPGKKQQKDVAEANGVQKDPKIFIACNVLSVKKHRRQDNRVHQQQTA